MGKSVLRAAALVVVLAIVRGVEDERGFGEGEAAGAGQKRVAAGLAEMAGGRDAKVGHRLGVSLLVGYSLTHASICFDLRELGRGI